GRHAGDHRPAAGLPFPPALPARLRALCRHRTNRGIAGRPAPRRLPSLSGRGRAMSKAPASEPPVVEVTDLAKHFPLRGGLWRRSAGSVKAVDGVGFEIAAGQTFGLVGESGCGKSTLAMLLVKLLEPSGGRIRLDGNDIAGLGGAALREFRKRVQLVFQDPYSSLDPRQKIASALS